MSIQIIKNPSEWVSKRYLHSSLNTLDDTSMLQDMQKKIQTQGDKAVIEYLQKFDKLHTGSFTLPVSKEEIKAAYTQVPKTVIRALQNAKANIEVFHKIQLPQNWESKHNKHIQFEIRYTALEAVGLYVPGGRAAYPSTVLMNAIPAKLAGVKKPVVVTPPQANGEILPQILVACDICGIDTIIKAGGAQVIFALAYGTESIPKVDKIVGPGNRFVTAAKQMVYGLVDIDKPAGPSEALVVCHDERYVPYAAAELLAQLEHDPDASAICITQNNSMIPQLQTEITKQLSQCSRKEIIEQSLKNSAILFSQSETETIQLINSIASEHLVLLMDDYQDTLNQVQNAGSIFCGPYTPVALGDYFAGPNHVLPTNGTARFASPLGVMDFIKYSSVLTYSQDALKQVKQDMKVLTEMEGFDAHYRSVEVRTPN